MNLRAHGSDGRLRAKADGIHALGLVGSSSVNDDDDDDNNDDSSNDGEKDDPPLVTTRRVDGEGSLKSLLASSQRRVLDRSTCLFARRGRSNGLESDSVALGHCAVGRDRDDGSIGASILDGSLELLVGRIGADLPLDITSSEMEASSNVNDRSVVVGLEEGRGSEHVDIKDDRASNGQRHISFDRDGAANNESSTSQRSRISVVRRVAHKGGEEGSPCSTEATEVGGRTRSAAVGIVGGIRRLASVSTDQNERGSRSDSEVSHRDVAGSVGEDNKIGLGGRGLNVGANDGTLNLGHLSLLGRSSGVGSRGRSRGDRGSRSRRDSGRRGVRSVRSSKEAIDVGTPAVDFTSTVEGIASHETAGDIDDGLEGQNDASGSIREGKGSRRLSNTTTKFSVSIASPSVDDRVSVQGEGGETGGDDLRELSTSERLKVEHSGSSEGIRDTIGSHLVETTAKRAATAKRGGMALFLVAGGNGAVNDGSSTRNDGIISKTELTNFIASPSDNARVIGEGHNVIVTERKLLDLQVDFRRIDLAETGVVVPSGIVDETRASGKNGGAQLAVAIETLGASLVVQAGNEGVEGTRISQDNAMEGDGGIVKHFERSFQLSALQVHNLLARASRVVKLQISQGQVISRVGERIDRVGVLRISDQVRLTNDSRKREGRSLRGLGHQVSESRGGSSGS